ncbi:hypothetical protein [Oenococcus oeni]|uniref:hypothetical protein n=6 Tax=Oenococcus oeni TaxID=1247 RepID=UPI0004DA16FB|nr:hypothetical protein [Oenococcus oeni]KER91761.1 hypothetical protein HS16_01890 [Oenococcus oeni]KER96270.1 hypothetical protein HT64_04630 [Oenococcus oeni]OIK70834.1 hypothetical protein ATW68_09780 [Oenococcus oeni]OIK79655.1 hypothetical protein ATW75_09190 [Oenococcus oeni]OIK90333.1 hypothetical protein ATW81_09530 [Oenococcus oeni]
MSIPLQATILNGNNLQVKGIYPVLDYDLIYDYIDNSNSTFVLNDNGASSLGDYIAIRIQNSSNLLYFGVLSSVDLDSDDQVDTLTVADFRNILNGDIIVTAKTGTSFEAHLIKLIKNYFTSTATTNALSYSLNNSTNTSFSVTNSDTIDTYNLVDYIERGLTLHNIVMSISSLKQGTSNGVPFYYPVVNIHQVSDKIQIKNNIAVFTNWQVTDSRLLRGYANELWIVDQASTDMENPSILTKYWLQKDGTIVSSINSNVVQPTQITISLFDKTATDNSTYAQIADQTLTGNEYSHQIIFSMPIENNFFSVEQLEIGLLATIVYNQTTYSSVLTAYEMSSSDDTISVTFGNLRNSLSDAFSSSD